MAQSDEVLALDVAQLSERLRRRELSPVEVAELYLERIERFNPGLGTFITVTADFARSQARAAEREIAAHRWRGPYHGIPVALKDLCYTRGIRTTAGSKILADFVPDYDATVWTRLSDAGAVLLGKLNLHEFACGVTSNNPHFGPVRNPYDPERIPGGSSGGSAAAIVAKLAAATVGTDTAGSIRIPAAQCGCVGLKPTYGLVSRYGVVPLSSTLDHVGPITRSVADAATMLNVIAGHDPNDSTSAARPVPDYTRALGGEITGWRIGVIRELAVNLSPEVAESFSRARELFATAGAIVEEVSIPSVAPAVSTAMRDMILRAEAFEFHQPWMKSRPDDYGRDVRRLMELGALVRGADYVLAQRTRAVMLAQTNRALSDYRVLIAPTCLITAAKIGAVEVTDSSGRTVDVRSALLSLTQPFNATGQPVLAIPTGLSSAGLPVSLQIIGRPYEEVPVITAAAAFERMRGSLPPPPGF